MADPVPTPDNAKVVGIYDRPANADRRWLKPVVFFIVVAIAAVVGYMMLRG